jgi:hypothetical protein
MPLMLALSEPEVLAALPSLGVSGVLAIAVVVLWRRSEARDAERQKATEIREARIAALEAKSDEHADQYRVLAEAVAEQIGRNTVVLEQTNEVMRQVLARLPAT